MGEASGPVGDHSVSGNKAKITIVVALIGAIATIAAALVSKMDTHAASPEVTDLADITGFYIGSGIDCKTPDDEKLTKEMDKVLYDDERPSDLTLRVSTSRGNDLMFERGIRNWVVSFRRRDGYNPGSTTPAWRVGVNSLAEQTGGGCLRNWVRRAD